MTNTLPAPISIIKVGSTLLVWSTASFVLYLLTLEFVNKSLALTLVGVGAHTPLPNYGNMSIAAAGQLKLAAVLFSELAEKPVYINEVCESRLCHDQYTCTIG